MPVAFPCGICSKPVARNHRAIKCDICKLWIHIKCNNLSKTEYLKHMDDDDNTTWICLLCTNAVIPFTGLFDETLMKH